MTSLAGRVLATIRRRSLFPDGARVLAAVSGGPDSVGADARAGGAVSGGRAAPGRHRAFEPLPSRRGVRPRRGVCRAWPAAVACRSTSSAATSPRLPRGPAVRSRRRRARRVTRSWSAPACGSGPRSSPSVTRGTIRQRRCCSGCFGAPGRADCAAFTRAAVRVVRPLIDQRRQSLVDGPRRPGAALGRGREQP